MAHKNEATSEGAITDTKTPPAQPSCFVMMPISDQEGYPAGHFLEVYESIIVPAVEACGYAAIRADQVSATNLIHLDILRRILDAPMAICDLSAANPNVMFELGIRQAFDRPVVLLKDTQTRKIFDIDSMRTIPYDSAMRPRAVNRAVADLTRAIEATRDAKSDEGLNSIVGLLGLHAAVLKRQDDDPASAQVALFSSAIQEIKYSIGRLQRDVANISASNEWKTAPPPPVGLSALGQDYPTSALGRARLAAIQARIDKDNGIISPDLNAVGDDSV